MVGRSEAFALEYGVKLRVGSVATGEIIAIGFAQRFHFSITALLADLSALIPHAIIQALRKMLCCHFNLLGELIQSVAHSRSSSCV